MLFFYFIFPQNLGIFIYFVLKYPGQLTVDILKQFGFSKALNIYKVLVNLVLILRNTYTV